MIVSNGSVLGFAPQALGETTPTLSNGYFYADTGMFLANKFATYAALYSAQPVVTTLVDKIASSQARLKLKVWDEAPATGKVEDTESDYAKLIASPCDQMSTFNFYRWTTSTYEVFGEAFWYKQRAGKDMAGRPTGKVVNLLPMHPSRVAVHRDAAGQVEYIFTLGVASAGILHAPSNDVVAFLRYNPESLMRGLSRLEPLRSTLVNEDASRRATTSFWNKGARPGMIITHPGELSQNAKDRLKASSDARHGGADNVGSTMILDEGMTAAPVQLTNDEMQYIDSRKMNMQEGCMVYDVPPPVVHILDHATFSNITEQMRSMYRDTMTPRLEDFESVVDFALRPEFFPIGQRVARYDMTDVLRGDFETRADKAVTLRNSGIFTGNQALELVGHPMSDDPEMDKLYANAALVQLGTPSQRVSITEAATPSPAMDAEASAAASGADAAAAGASNLSKAVTRSLNGYLSRKATTKDLRAGLVAGHQSELDKFFGKQRESVKSAVGKKSAGAFDPEAWDGDLTTILHSLSEATAKAIGAKVAADLGGRYDGGDIAEYLTANAKSTAQSINQTTADQIAKALARAAESEESEDPEDAIDGLFDGEIAARSNQISLTRVAVIGGLAALVAARLSKAKTKMWVVTSGKPRASHASMSGETVELNTLFSNGMNGPGDYSGGADEVAGCSCDLSFSTD
ncbi:MULTISPECIES: phage portal protein [unclassified Cryobacterium]|uniref:phage portal protein n=1 Tax=unclassified Cryobacterium TaxID=2649013 RepID=UPI00106B2BFF|nr:MULTISPECIES: phage portal protein [unclassified Cryobacterium]TFB96534.1 phage portal protein [Cryobacterium sp. MDB2-A-1]TFC12819.1 phage portal protein [Cryobacterium sp. MDB2-A-2]